MKWLGLRWMGRFLAVLVLCVSVWAAPPERFVARVSHVTDGDTLWVEPQGGGSPRKLRLLGIDAPEICQNGGTASRAALQTMVAHRRVEVQVAFNDSYERGLASIYLDGQDVAATMVLSGQAWAERWHNRIGRFEAQEADARAAGRGLFADPLAELPRDFRRRHGSCQTPGQPPLAEPR